MQDDDLKIDPTALKPLPKYLQISICSGILLLLIFGSIFWIGRLEYEKQFCEPRLELREGDKVALLHDYKNIYTKTVSTADGHEKESIGCCRVPEGDNKVSLKDDCVYAPDYQAPTTWQRIAYFFKKF